MANIVFSKQGSFTISELKEELAGEGIEKSEEEIVILDRLIDSGLIIKHDSSYSACV